MFSQKKASRQLIVRKLSVRCVWLSICQRFAPRLSGWEFAVTMETIGVTSQPTNQIKQRRPYQYKVLISFLNSKRIMVVRIGHRYYYSSLSALPFPRFKLKKYFLEHF